MRRLAVLLVLAPLFAATPAAARDTLDRTLVPEAGQGFVGLREAAGDRRVVRRAPGARARAARERTRRSLLFFGQLTDPQLEDEMSPLRADFLDAAGNELKDTWRPQESLGPQTFDQVVRAMNRERTSPVTQGNRRRARMRLVVATGDMADNQQLNETVWFRTVLDGGRVDPFSGTAIGPGSPCAGLPADVVARLNADVAARRYTGVQDYDDWPLASPRPYTAGYWDPDEPARDAVATPYAAFPRYPGLLDRAQAPFAAAGLRVPWYVARGNHDGLIEGNLAAGANALLRGLAPGCSKVFPTAVADPATFVGAGFETLVQKLAEPGYIPQLLASASPVPPDPSRRVIGEPEFQRVVGGRHGFRHVARAERRASDGNASYYAWSPRRGLRFVALDTVAEGGGSSGNLDHPQYRWLSRELRGAQRRGELAIVFGHHPLASMGNRTPDEAAGTCPDGCDGDPRRSTPLHLGDAGRRNVRALLLAHPVVIAYVAGHSHDNHVRLQRRGRRAFWQVTTSSHVDWPQQSRTFDLMDNRDGTLSLFGTIVDHDAPASAPPAGPAAAFSDAQLASISRVLSWNDPQRKGLPPSGEPGDRRGRAQDRNVELVLRDPR